VVESNLLHCNYDTKFSDLIDTTALQAIIFILYVKLVIETVKNYVPYNSERYISAPKFVDCDYRW